MREAPKLTSWEREEAVLEALRRRARRTGCSDEALREAEKAARDALAAGASGHRALEVGNTKLAHTKALGAIKRAQARAR